MRISSKISLLLLLFVSLVSMPALADVDKDKDKDKKGQQSDAGLNKSQIGACNTGSASLDLDVNNVRARLYNNGHLFWKGSGNVYTVPKTGNANAIFASGIWLGGMVGNEMRFAGTDYGPFEFFPGPLDDQGNPPADCSPFDRIYSITKDDLDAFEAGEPHTADIEDWPWQLGAPVVDGDGNPNNYNLAGGDRPELTGTQTAWWIMNDVAGPHEWSQSAPIGLEVQVTAFAFRRADALNNTTFYKYKLIYKGSQPLTNTYFGIWSDPDLGNAGDDFVGSDTTLGMGFVYNGDDFDDTSVGYGGQPPALGYDFFQGPLVNNDGRDNDGDGEVDEDDERIAMSKFIYYNNDSTPIGNPFTGDEAYGYLRGIWRDGKPVTLGGDGYGGDVLVDYMFPGDPTTAEFWSEENIDGAGARNTPADRRFLLSSGPFIMNPGDEQEIVYGIVWAQGADRLSSVSKMKADDALAQAAFDVNFELPQPPDAPRVTASTFDETVALTWTNPPTSNNFLNSFDVPNPFLEDVPEEVAPDKTYTFEGYKIFRYRNENQGDAEGELVATFDVPNDVTTITDTEFDPSTGVPITLVVARGTDSGVKHNITFSNLTNYQEYHYGVQAYAYNEFSAPKVLASPVTRVTVMPRAQTTLAGGTNLPTEEIERRGAAADTLGADVVGVLTGGGQGSATANIVDPTQLTGHTYEVRFYEQCVEVEDAGHKRGSIEVPQHQAAKTVSKSQSAEECFTNYDIVDVTTGETKFSGREAFDITHEPAPQLTDVMVIDGLSFSVVGPPPAFLGMDQRAAPGSDEIIDSNLFHSLNAASQREAGGVSFYIDGAGAIDWVGGVAGKAPREHEIRFVENPEENGQVAISGWTGGREDDRAFMMKGWLESADRHLNDDDEHSFDTLRVEHNRLPFTVWELDPIAGTETQVHFAILDDDDDGFWGPIREASFGPAYERIYATNIPYDEDFLLNNADDIAIQDEFWDCWPDCHTFGRLMIAPYLDPAVGLYYGVPPSPGTVIRFVTSKPNLPGDVFALSTEGLGVVRGDQQTAEASLESIGIVPNPYKGASNYEVSVTDDVVRFTNLPDRARIRVFTLSGTQVWDQTRGAGNNEWDLKTSEGLPLASGMYLVVVEVDGVGKKIIKFGVVKKRIQLDLL